VALFAGIGTAQARFYLGVGIGLPGVAVVVPPVVVAPVPMPAAPVEVVPAAPAPGYVWVPGRMRGTASAMSGRPVAPCCAMAGRRLAGRRLVPRAAGLGLAGGYWR